MQRDNVYCQFSFNTLSPPYATYLEGDSLRVFLFYNFLFNSGGELYCDPQGSGHKAAHFLVQYGQRALAQLKNIHDQHYEIPVPLTDDFKQLCIVAGLTHIFSL